MEQNSYPLAIDGDKLTGIAFKQLLESTDYKKSRLAKIKLYEDTYAGVVPKKLRQMFNVPLPIFSGMIDTLLSDFEEPIQLKFEEQEPADYFKAKKISAAWNTEKDSQRAGAKWDLKSRWDKKLALISGRGVLLYYAESDPQYSSHLEVVDYNDFHCEPNGGGHLENHLFAGQEGIKRTKEEIVASGDSGFYNKEQVTKLTIAISTAGDYLKLLDYDQQQKLNRFKALGLDPATHNYIGQQVFNLCQWVTTFEGQRYYIVFDPWTKIWLKCEKLKDVYSTNMFPWVSWATHEDPKVFWSKSFADDLYPIADSVTTMFNQELTNREKKNFGARAYDKDMFTDVQRLDQAQYRPDALVPVDTKGGTRRIGEGIYRFDTAELSGTINMIDWISNYAGQQVGATGLSQGVADKGKKPSVVFAEQGETDKRISLRSQSYTEAWGEIGLRYIQGLKDHMPAEMAIRVIGENGFEWDTITRMDLSMKADLSVKVLSSRQQQNNNRLKVEARSKAIDMIVNNPALVGQVNPKWVVETALRDLGGYEDADIKVAMDTQNYGNKETLAKASEAIQFLIRKQVPPTNFSADTEFMQKIADYAVDHREKLGPEMFNTFMDYVDKHALFATENMARRANKMMAEKAMQGGGAPAGPTPSPIQTPGVKQAINQP